MEHLNMLAKCGRRVKNGKEGQKGKEEAKEIGFLKLDTSASNPPAKLALFTLFFGLGKWAL